MAYWLDIVNNHLDLVPELGTVDDDALGVCNLRELTALPGICSAPTCAATLSSWDQMMQDAYSKVQNWTRSRRKAV
jgi:hypothetical protein